MKHRDWVSRLGLCCLIGLLVPHSSGTAAASGAPYRICLVGLDGSGQPILPPGDISAPAGSIVKVGVWIDPVGGSAEGIQRFELLICFDANVLARMVVLRGADLAAGWEYFTYRSEQSGQIRVIGIADLPGGAPVGPDVFNPKGVIASLAFFVISDAALVGACTSVSFCSFACGDNDLVSRSGDTLYMPTGIGITFGPEYDLSTCLQGGGSAAPLPFADFCPTAICVTDLLPGCGDVNLNGIRGEIADVILFANYFLYGMGAFDPVIVPIPFPRQELDCDGDGHVGISDLVIMIRMFLGGIPMGPGGGPKLGVSPESADLFWSVSDGALRIRASSDADIGGMLLTYHYSGFEINDVSLRNESGMTIRSHAAQGELRVLVYPDPTAKRRMTPAGSNDIVTIPLNGNGTIELVDQEACDYSGSALFLRATGATPREFGLQQNYPNPFNAGTIIPFRLESDSDWKLTIYNVAGQAVRTFGGHDAAGLVQVEWDGTADAGTAQATGVYFCRLDAGGVMSSRRIVLLK